MFWAGERALMLIQLLLNLLQAVASASSSCSCVAAGTPSDHVQLALRLQEAQARRHATRMLAARAHEAAQRGTDAAASSAAAATGGSAATAKRAAASGLGCRDIKQLQDQSLDTAGTAEQNSSTTQTQAVAAEHTSSVPTDCAARVRQLPPALAAFKGVTVQIISCFESFVRAAAAGLVDGSLEHCGMTLQPEHPDSGWDPEQCSACVMTQSIGRIVARARLTNGRVGWTPGPLLALVQAAGPGRFEQRQMYSLLRSVVKFSKAFF